MIDLRWRPSTSVSRTFVEENASHGVWACALRERRTAHSPFADDAREAPIPPFALTARPVDARKSSSARRALRNAVRAYFRVRRPVTVTAASAQPDYRARPGREFGRLGVSCPDLRR